MSAPRFTPGPWTYDRCGAVWATGGEEGDLAPVAQIATDPEREVPENGHLIAAAPDLYAALSSMDLDCMECPSGDDTECGRCLTCVARGSLAKARGEA